MEPSKLSKLLIFMYMGITTREQDVQTMSPKTPAPAIQTQEQEILEIEIKPKEIVEK